MKMEQFSYNAEIGWKNLFAASALDSPQTLVMAFCSPTFRNNERIFKQLKNNFSKSTVIGCSTSGEIIGTEIHDLSISLVAVKFEQASFKVIEALIENSDQSNPIGSQIGEFLNSSDLKGIILFSDGLITNGSALALGINSKVNKNIIVAGGLAGDGSDFSHTWVLHNDKIKDHIVLAVGLYGESLDLSNASRGGWDKFGPERLITRSRGNVLYEIDGRPALDLYKEYLGERSKDLPASGLFFPLQIRSSKADENRLVRTLLSVNEQEKSVTFAGDIPQGYIAQLMKANFERVIEAAANAGDAIKKPSDLNKQNDSSNVLTLAISCVGRRLVLGERAEEELEALKMALPSKSLVSGFYSYGELGANILGGACDLHNQSMTVLSVTEKSVGSNRSAS